MPKDLVAANGVVAWSARHTAFGRIIEEGAEKDGFARYGGKVDSPFRLLGQVADEEVGLTFTRFRCFDPEVGRWVSPDPLGFEGGANLFGFDGSPTRVVDPLGLATKTGNTHRAARAAAKISADARDGKLRTFDRGPNNRSHHDEHGFSDEQARQILANPDSVHLATNGNLIFRRGPDVVITEGPGSGQDNVITAFGSSGHERNQPGIPGTAVTDDMIANGTMRRSGGGTFPPAQRLDVPSPST